MKEVFETYGGVIIASIIAAIIIAGIVLMLSSGGNSGSEGALHKLIIQFYESISGS